MATYIKYDCFVADLCGKVHDLLGTSPGSDCDNIRVALSDTAGDIAVTKATLATCTQITNGNGYATGGLPLIAGAGLNSGAAASGTFTLTGTNQVWTSSGAGMAEFQYVLLYNDTVANDPLIAAWNYGTPLTLAVGETFTIKFNNGASSGTILTLA
jgi:hypothetical protein